MMIDSGSDGHFDPDVARLRRDWVAAYRAWTEVADGRALTSTAVTDEQRVALRRYQAAEIAYFAHLRVTTDNVRA